MKTEPELEHISGLQDLKSNALAEVIYVRETFKVVPATYTSERSVEEGNEAVEASVLPVGHLVKLKSEETHFMIKTSETEGKSTDCSDKRPKLEILASADFKEVSISTDKEPSGGEIERKQAINKSINQTDETKVFQKGSISVDIDLNTSFQDDPEDTRSVGTQESSSSDKLDKATTVDLSLGGINNIEELLASLSRRVRNVEQIDRDFARVDDLVDNDDSARAESVASLVSSTSSRGREREPERMLDGGSHSLIRRQSVIIEGLTLETEELRKKCHDLEDELVTPVVEDLSQKLEQVEGKLEETENYCYQVVEENVELKSDMEALESEITEVQDTFRDKDAKEFKKVKWELENLSKTCRNLQIKLGKAQAKASRLRQEKEMIEDEQREQNLWKTSAVVAVAALAAYQLFSRLK